MDVKDLTRDHASACSGWLHMGELTEGNDYERFQRQAQVLDALRSLCLASYTCFLTVSRLCVQLPFLLWRLYFTSYSLDLISFGGQTMLIVKNLSLKRWFCFILIDIPLDFSRKHKDLGSYRPIGDHELRAARRGTLLLHAL